MAEESDKQAMFNRGYEQGYATGKIHAHRETHAHIVSMVKKQLGWRMERIVA